MNEMLLQRIVILALMGSAAALGMSLRKNTTACQFLGIAVSSLLCFEFLALSLFCRRLPLYGGLEALPSIALFPALCATILSVRRQARHYVPIFWGMSCVLLALPLLLGSSLNPDFFMYGFFYTQAFFFCRLLSMCFLACAICWQLGLLFFGQDDPFAANHMLSARAHLIASAAFFMAAELCGSIWCMYGWGDTLHWNSQFFMGYIMFICLMIPCHLPPTLARKLRLRALVSVVPMLFVFLLYVSKQS